MKSAYQQFKDLSWSSRKLAKFNAAFEEIESLLNYSGHDEELLEGIRDLLASKKYRGTCTVSEFDVAQVLLIIANRVQVQESLN